MSLRDTRYSHLKLVDLDPVVEEMPSEPDEFDLLGMWYTRDQMIALVTEIDNHGFMLGIVSRNGRVYECTWDHEQRSVAPFRSIDDLAIKLG